MTRDGGMTFAKPLTIANGALSAFARLDSGTVLVGALVNLTGGGGGTMGAGYRSTDGALTFSPWTLDPDPAQPHLVGLGERVVGGQSTLYLSGKNYSDGWALAVSTDEGVTVTPVMSYDQVAGIKPCVQQLCLDTCNYEEMQAIWDPAVCAGRRRWGERRRDRSHPELGMSLRGRRRRVVGRCGPRWTRCWWPRRPPPPAPASPRAARSCDPRFPSVLRLDSRGSAV